MSSVEVQKALRAALNNTFVSFDQLEELVYEAHGKVLDEVVPEGTIGVRIMRLIRIADSELWLEALIGAAQKLRQTDPRFTALLAQAQPVALLPGSDHYETCWLDSGRSQAIVDRTVLREALRKLDDPRSGIRIVVVDGEPTTGKSYSREFIKYLRETLQSFNLVAVDLLQVGESEVLASHLAWQLADRFRITDLPSRDNEQGGKWAGRVANRLTLALNDLIPDDNAKSLWIVIDGFNNVTVADETRDLVKQIAWRIADELPKVRLVLLSYRKAGLPVAIEDQVAEEIINLKISDIEKDVEPFFAQLYDQRAKADGGFQYTPADLQQSVARVVLELDREGGPRTLRRLSAALVKVAGERELLRHGS